MITKQAELAAIHAVQSAIDRDRLDWVAGETSISRLSPDEKALLYNAKVGPPIEGVPIKSRPLHLQGVADPEYFDWRNKDGKNWVTPVRHQGTCGSCWAFSATGAIEAAFNIYSGNPNLNIDLSEQHVVSDCCHEAKCGNCGGGWPDWTLIYCRDHGIPDEACSPYVARNTPCTPCDDVSDRKVKITNYVYISPSTSDFKWALQEYGTMSVVITHPEDWFYYTSGVYKPTADAVGWADHAILLVGWDDTLGDRGAWICKNSHGTGFGEDGYALVDFGVLEGYRYAYAVTGVEDADPYVDERCVTHCGLLLDYDEDGDGVIDFVDVLRAISDQGNGIITDDEYAFIYHVYTSGGIINDVCPGCYGDNDNTPPTAIASAIPMSGKVPLNVQFTGQGTDLDGTIQSYNWNFGDGNMTNIQNPSHTYNMSGTYTPVLTVTDNEGAIGTDSLSISAKSDIYGGWYTPIAADASSYDTTRLPEKSIDGAWGTADDCWFSDYEMPCRIWFDMGDIVEIDKIRMVTGTCPVPMTFYVETSDDCAAWHRQPTLHTISDSYTPIDFDIDKVSTRYIRINIRSATQCLYGGVCEFSVHIVGDEVANIDVVSFTATPLLCQMPCNVDVSITWENTGTASATFTPGYTVDGTLYSSSSITLAPGQQGTLNETLTSMLTGSYEICPVPN